MPVPATSLKEASRGMVWVSGGISTFPIRTPISAFYLDQSEFTNADGIRMMETVREFWKSKYGSSWTMPKSPSGFDRSKQPLVGLAPHEAKIICETQGKRLPTPYEWSLAAGGLNFSTKNGRLEHPGVHYCSDLRDETKCPKTTRDVGAARGHYRRWDGIELYDMDGNVSEWTFDLTGGFYLCGGSWGNFISDLGWHCFPSDLSLPHKDAGVRCALSP